MGPSLKTESPNYPKKPGQITDIPKPELHKGILGGMPRKVQHH